MERVADSNGLQLPLDAGLLATVLVGLEDGFALQEVLDSAAVNQQHLWDAVDVLAEAITALASAGRKQRSLIIRSSSEAMLRQRSLHHLQQSGVRVATPA